MAFHEKNESIRIDVLTEADENMRAALASFFRRLGMTHVLKERIGPTLKSGGALVVAVRDRSWPPWGLDAQNLQAVCQVYPAGENTFAITPVITTDENATNIGLISAVYKEALEHVLRDRKAQIAYLVAEGSFLADRVLTENGFTKSNDLAVTDHGRYHVYRAPAAKLLARLSLDKRSTADLLAHDLDAKTLQRNASLQGMIAAATRGALSGILTRSEIILIDFGRFTDSLPGGVPPTPPTAGPSKGPIFRGGDPFVINPRRVQVISKGLKGVEGPQTGGRAKKK
jgi:hypothetical protein